MLKLTITEALQEIKTIGARLGKKRDAVAPYLARDARIRDPFEKEGGSEKFLIEERQSIADLENRVVALRTAIQRSNLASPLAVGIRTRTVAEWLTWRREISKGQQTFVRALIQGLSSIRANVQQKGGKIIAAAAAVAEAPGANDPNQVIICVDERKLLEESDTLEQTLGELDGKLSLFNATTVVEV